MKPLSFGACLYRTCVRVTTAIALLSVFSGASATAISGLVDSRATLQLGAEKDWFQSQRHFSPNRNSSVARKENLSSADNGNTIDLMVVYSTAVTEFFGSNEAIVDEINRNVTRINMAFADSGINTQIRLVHKREIKNFPEGGVRFHMLPGVQDTVANYLPRLRDRYGADLVMVISDIVENDRGTRVCGLGAQPNIRNDPSGEFGGYSWVSGRCLEGSMVFGHEIGHNLNAQHDIEAAGVSGADNPKRFNFGYLAESLKSRTIMTPPTSCATHFCAPYHFFSTPGNGIFSQPIGERRANNTQSINNIRRKIARYRAAKVSRDLAPSIWVNSISGVLNFDKPTIQFIANGEDVRAWRIKAGRTRQMRQYISPVLKANTRTFTLPWMPPVAVGQIYIGLEYLQAGTWKRNVHRVHIDRGDRLQLIDYTDWMRSVLNGWGTDKQFLPELAILKAKVAQLRTYIVRRKEVLAEKVIKELAVRFDGCKQTRFASDNMTKDSNDWITSCWAQQELQLGIRLIKQHVDTLETMGIVKGLRGRCMQAQTGQRSAVFMNACSSTPKNNQTWKFTDSGKLMSGGKCLEASADSSATDQRVTVADCSGEVTQFWSMDGNKLFSNARENTCLSVIQPRNNFVWAIETTACENSSSFQNWRFIDF